MKKLFLSLFGLLILGTVGTYMSLPSVTHDHPVLYYVTDPNPLRQEQIDGYPLWLESQGLPKSEVLIDSSNNDITKQLIQSVSGVGADFMDLGNGGIMRYFQSMGILSDLTEVAKERGFSPESTWPTILPQITVDGRQYSYPANVSADLYFVGKAAFAAAGQPLPPERWTLEEFERLGTAYVKAANPPGTNQHRFFANRIDMVVLRHSMGIGTFNETFTRCQLADPKALEAMALLKRWTFELRLIPSALEARHMAADASFAGSDFFLFKEGYYAMILFGRWALIFLRTYGDLEMALVEPPYAELPNCMINVRSISLYPGTAYPDHAVNFMAYLASEEYNQRIVRTADALPPNPKFTRTADFLRPPEHPNEWGLHERFVQAAEELAIGVEYSPFALPARVADIEQAEMEAFMSGLYDAEEAAQRMDSRIQREVDRNLAQNPALRARFREYQDMQKQIDALKEMGLPIPEEMIINPYYRVLYRQRGMLAP